MFARFLFVYICIRAVTLFSFVFHVPCFFFNCCLSSAPVCVIHRYIHYIFACDKKENGFFCAFPVDSSTINDLFSSRKLSWVEPKFGQQKEIALWLRLSFPAKFKDFRRSFSVRLRTDDWKISCTWLYLSPLSSFNNKALRSLGAGRKEGRRGKTEGRGWWCLNFPFSVKIDYKRLLCNNIVGCCLCYLACAAKNSVKLFKLFLTSLAKWPTFPVLDAEPPIDWECDIEIKLMFRWLPRLKEEKEGGKKYD